MSRKALILSNGRPTVSTVAFLESGDSPLIQSGAAGGVTFWYGASTVSSSSSFLYDDALKKLTMNGHIDMGAGTSFPASPPTNAQYFRTDLGWLCYYDGSRWLTAHDYSESLSQATYTVNTGTAVTVFRADYDPYITRCMVNWKVDTTVNGSNYWTLTLRGLNIAHSAASNADTFNTGGGAAGVWDKIDRAPNTSATLTNKAVFEFQVIKTGSPGTLTAIAAFMYKLIVT